MESAWRTFPDLSSASITGVYTDGSLVCVCGIDQRLSVWSLGDDLTVHFLHSEFVDVSDVCNISVLQRYSEDKR